jgi:hypothetical protein
MVMSMAVRLAAAPGPRFSIPDRFGHPFRGHDGPHRLSRRPRLAAVLLWLNDV